MRLSIDLARRVLDRANDADERGAAGNDLAVALSILGERESGTDRLEEAVTAYRSALEERTRDRVPLDWAMTQMNLGFTLTRLGERQADTSSLEKAVQAYENALLEHTRERVPMQWATTQVNMGLVASAYFDKTGEIAQLDLAEQRYRDAREVYEMAGASYYLEVVDRNLAIIAKLRQSLPGAD